MVQVGGGVAVCTSCGASIRSGAGFCPNCGLALSDTLQVPVVAPPTDPRPIPGRGAPVRPRHGAVGTPLFAAFLLLLISLIVAAALGQWLISLLLVPVVVTLGAAVATLTWGDIEEPVDQFFQRATENVWSFGRVARVSVTNWSRAGRVEATLRARRRRLRARQSQLLRDLGQAVLTGEPTAVDAARQAAAANAAEIESLTHSVEALRTRIASRVQEERDATASTETFPTPGGRRTQEGRAPEGAALSQPARRAGHLSD